MVGFERGLNGRLDSFERGLNGRLDNDEHLLGTKTAFDDGVF